MTPKRLAGVLAAIVLADGDANRMIEILEAFASYDKDPCMIEAVKLTKILIADEESGLSSGAITPLDAMTTEVAT